MRQTATCLEVTAPTLVAVRCSLLAIVLYGAAAWAQTPQEVQTVAEQVIQRLDLQTNLPRTAEKPKLSIKLPPELLWIVVAIALAILVYAFRDMIPILRLHRRPNWGLDEDAADEARAPRAALVLRTADELAAEGRFVEAMHVLLLQGLADIRQHLHEQFADSLTSREILRSTKLAEAGRIPLREIIDRVEWTYFGGRPAALVDYQACRASFSALGQALRGTAAGTAA